MDSRRSFCPNGLLKALKVNILEKPGRIIVVFKVFIYLLFSNLFRNIR